MDNKNIDRKLKKYYGKIKRTLLCPGKEKKKFLADFKNSIEDFQSEHPGISFEDIQKHFGTPKSINEAFSAELDSETLKRRKHIKMIKIAILCVLISVAAFAIGLFTYIIATNDPGYSYEETVEDFGTTEIIEE